MEQKYDLAGFYKKYYPQGLHYIRLFIYDEEDARDAVSAVFLALLEMDGSRWEGKSLEALFFAMVRNKGVDYVRRRKRLHKVEERMKQTADRYSDDEFAALCQRETFRLIGQAMGKMNRMQERVFREIRLEGRSYKDVGKELCLSCRSVEYQLRRATEKVRERLRLMYG